MRWERWERWERWFLLGVLASALACPATESEPEPKPEPEPAPKPEIKKTAPLPSPTEPETLEGFIVIQGKTPWFASATAEKHSATFGTDPQTTLALEVVGHEGERVHVRTAQLADGRHCTPPWSDGEAFDLDFWIRRGDAILVVRAPVLQTFDDGTSVKLAAGVPLLPQRPGSDGVHETRASAGGLRVKIPPSSVGRSYQLGAAWSPGAPKLEVPSATKLTVGAQKLANDLLFDDGPIPVFDHQERPAGHIVSVGNSCAELRALSSTRPERPPEEPPPKKETRRPPFRFFDVPKDVQLTWPDGEKAGRTRERYSVSSDMGQENGRRCFDAGGVELCAAEADVVDPTAGVVGALGSKHVGSSLVGSGGTGGSAAPRTEGEAKEGTPAIKGSLDKAIIRRVVRRHRNEVKYCYEKELRTDPSLSGKVSVQFTIDAKGSVPVAIVTDNTTGSKPVGKCIANAIKRWKFPKPSGGGIVTVTYPFVLSPG